MVLSSAIDLDSVRQFLESFNVLLNVKSRRDVTFLNTVLSNVLSTIPYLVADSPRERVEVDIAETGSVYVKAWRPTLDSVVAYLGYVGDRELVHRCYAEVNLLTTTHIVQWLSYPHTCNVAVFDIEKLSPSESAIYLFLMPLSVPKSVLEELMVRVENLDFSPSVSIMKVYKALIEGAKQLGLETRPSYPVEYALVNDGHLVQIPVLSVAKREDVEQFAVNLAKMLDKEFSEAVEFRIHYIPDIDKYRIILTPRRGDTKVYLTVVTTVAKDPQFWCLYITSSGLEELRQLTVKTLLENTYSNPCEIRKVLENLVNKAIKTAIPLHSEDFIRKRIASSRQCLFREDTRFIREAVSFVKKCAPKLEHIV